MEVLHGSFHGSPVATFLPVSDALPGSPRCHENIALAACAWVLGHVARLLRLWAACHSLSQDGWGGDLMLDNPWIDN